MDECKDNNTLTNLNLLTHSENVNWGTRNERASKKKGKKIIMDGDMEFDSLTKAARYLECTKTKIWRFCKNPTHSIYGHTFRYK